MGVVNFRTLHLIFLTRTFFLTRFFFGFTEPLYRMISGEISLPCLSSRFTDQYALITWIKSNILRIQKSEVN